MFTAEITLLFVANRQWNTLKIVCSGATDYGRLIKTNNKIGEEIALVSNMHSCNVCYMLEAWFPVIMTWTLSLHLKFKKIQPEVCLFELRFIIIVRYIAAIKVKNQSTSTLSLMCGPSVQKAVRRLLKKQSVI